jgi:hypothetical protein
MSRISIRGLAMGVAGATALAGLAMSVDAFAAESPLGGPDRAADPQSNAAAAPPLAVQERREVQSRQARSAAATAEAAALAKHRREVAARRARARASRAQTQRLLADPRLAGRVLAERRGWGNEQFRCLNSLWTRESDWRTTARNSSSGAYGIPQALPASKLASAGADWRHNPLTQIRWGLGYIDSRYGTPCSAWRTFQTRGWY